MLGTGGVAAGCLLGMYLNKDYKSFREFYLDLLSFCFNSDSFVCTFDKDDQMRADLSCASDPDTPTKVYADPDRYGLDRYSSLECYPDISKNR